jgi:hypothetical protein
MTAPGRLPPDEAFQKVLQQVGDPHEARNLIKERVGLGHVKIYVNESLVDAGYFASSYSLVLGYFDAESRLILKKSPDGRYHALVWPAKPLTDPSGNWELDAGDIGLLLESIETSSRQTGRKRGKKVKFNWDAVFGEFVRRVFVEGLPPIDKGDDAEAERLFRWCLDHFQSDNEIPATETLRKKIGVWLRPLKSRRT